MAQVIPRTMRKLVASRLSQKFREVVEIKEVPVPSPGDGEVLIKNKFVGINATEINFTAGRYDPNVKPPLDIGFEGMGEVVGVGSNTKLKPGQPVMYMSYGAFAEYKIVPARAVIPLPSLSAAYIPFLVSGMTASIALEKVGDLKSGETVLITAAAGGTGQFAVQWAKQAGCHVIGTCSTPEKVEFLKKIGCDRPINYKTENLRSVLKSEYPKGVDIIYESIGGDIFETCIDSLAVKGRLIVIGFIEGYKSDLGFTPSRTIATLPVKLLKKSASVRGFFLEHFRRDTPMYATKMIDMYNKGTLKSFVDLGETSEKGKFSGLLGISDAVDYLYSQKSIGKIVVDLDATSSKL
ncbi:hypothetical protein FSP39_024417 [Pinctada imbricata]|uniref:15-oxoprostaglandin 13-reductase n=1 Tax=Pinctada imbricata TaxID=66713 RepID=A0AA89C387_PINIB|nr:hypothetical protein FSP39_024417 [Pinctada imbricata]